MNPESILTLSRACAKSALSRYRKLLQGQDWREYWGHAWEGAMRGVEEYDPDKGPDPLRYAARRSIAAVRNALRSEGLLIRPERGPTEPEKEQLTADIVDSLSCPPSTPLEYTELVEDFMAALTPGQRPAFAAKYGDPEEEKPRPRQYSTAKVYRTILSQARQRLARNEA